MTSDPMNQANQLASRVAELESRYTHLQRLVEDLNEVLVQLGRQCEGLERNVARLAQQQVLLSQHPEETRRLEDEKPPHY